VISFSGSRLRSPLWARVQAQWPAWIAPVFGTLGGGLAGLFAAEPGLLPLSCGTATVVGAIAGLLAGLVLDDAPEAPGTTRLASAPLRRVLSPRKRLLCAAYFAAAWTGIVAVAVAAWYVPWHVKTFGSDPDVEIAAWRANFIVVRPLLAALVVASGPLALGCRGSRACRYVWVTLFAGSATWFYYLLGHPCSRY
jgi:hypothetical protein